MQEIHFQRLADAPLICYAGKAKAQRLTATRLRQHSSYVHQAVAVSVDTVQILQRHRQAKSPIVQFSASLQSGTASSDLNGAALGHAAALGVLRCLPYELPMLTAMTVYQDAYKNASTSSRSGVKYSADRRVNPSCFYIIQIIISWYDLQEECY